MAEWKSEAEARDQIKALVADYYHDFVEKKKPFAEGNRMLPVCLMKRKCRA